MTATFTRHRLNFKTPSGTSRGILRTKNTWIVKIEEDTKVGFGECGMFKGLSVDDRPDFETKLRWACDNINKGLTALRSDLATYPSILFGMEMAFTDLKSRRNCYYYPSKFTEGRDSIPINGLIWMGPIDNMKTQIKEKIDQGFNCIKLKIGALDFDAELNLLKSIRSEFSVNDIELRVDANGAFQPREALQKLASLSTLNLHSIEQPIKQGQWREMAILCKQTPMPIALDEELIGIFSDVEKKTMLKQINPQYIILKPTLLGGFNVSEGWIEFANSLNIGWWITSALESNIGLNAIAQWTYTLNNTMPQGLGTGGLFTNNFESPLFVKNGTLHYQN